MIRLAVAVFLSLCSVAQAQSPVLPGPGLPVAAAGGPAFDAAASAQRSGGTGSLSWTHTPVGTPTGVAVGLTNFTSNCTISTVTYGGTSMTAAQTISPNINNEVRLYGLANPSSGAQTVSINFSSGTNCFIAGGSITVTGGNTTTVFRASNQAQGTSTTTAASVTSASGDLVVDVGATIDNSISLTAVTGSQTSRISNKAGGGNRMSMATLTASGASTGMGWTIASSNLWAELAASFQP